MILRPAGGIALLAALSLGAAVTAVAQGESDAFLDASARDIVTRARARSESENRLIQGYRVVAKQQMGMRLQAFGRERIIFEQDRAVRIEWERDAPARVAVLGSRESAPIVGMGARPELEEGNINGSIVGLVFEPDREWMLRTPLGDAGGTADTTAQGGYFHPLARGSEANYRFRTGDSTSIRLPDGAVVRLIELQVIPRRPNHQLLSGSLWLDATTLAPVRGAFRFTVPMALGVSTDRGGWGLSGEFNLFLVEYGLWQGRWWLPRLFVLQGSATAGSITAPIEVETRYEDFEIFSTPASAGRPAPEIPWPDSLGQTAHSVRTDTTSQCRGRRRIADGSCRSYEVWIPRDSTLLVNSDQLPPETFGDRGDLVTQAEIRQGIEALYSSGVLSDFLTVPGVNFTLLDPSLVHYNRVEGLTLGPSASMEIANLRAEGSAWIGLGDRDVGAEASLIRTRYSGRERVTLYRRLDAFSPAERPFGLGNSAGALLFGSDQGDYFRTLGGELTWTPGAAANRFYELRAFAEIQRPVAKSTDFSFAGLLGAEDFRANRTATRANQIGLSGTLRLTGGVDPDGWRTGMELGALAESGSYTFLRPAITAYATTPLPGIFAGLVEASLGSSVGELTSQRLWNLGGSTTIRGITPEGGARGEHYWRGRAELGTESARFRLIGFTDLGWVGAREQATLNPTLWSAGVGASVLDGLIRMDVAHPIRGGSGWHFNLRLGGGL